MLLKGMRFEAREEIIANKKLKLFQRMFQACFPEWKEYWKIVFTPNDVL